MAGKNRRKEALPHWCYSRGVKYDDGLYLPTKKEPFTDGLTGATPHSGFDVKMQPADGLKQFRIKIEINHSTDFNESYPKSAQEGDDNYSGGKEERTTGCCLCRRYRPDIRCYIVCRQPYRS